MLLRITPLCHCICLIKLYNVIDIQQTCYCGIRPYTCTTCGPWNTLAPHGELNCIQSGFTVLRNVRCSQTFSQNIMTAEKANTYDRWYKAKHWIWQRKLKKCIILGTNNIKIILHNIMSTLHTLPHLCGYKKLYHDNSEICWNQPSRSIILRHVPNPGTNINPSAGSYPSLEVEPPSKM